MPSVSPASHAGRDRASLSVCRSVESVHASGVTVVCTGTQRLHMAFSGPGGAGATAGMVPMVPMVPLAPLTPLTPLASLRRVGTRWIWLSSNCVSLPPRGSTRSSRTRITCSTRGCTWWYRYDG